MFNRLFDRNNGLMITMSWITDCLFLSMLWLMFSVLIIPLGPASAALYDTTVHTFRMNEEVVYGRFFRSLRKNMKCGIPAGLICLAIGIGGYQLWNRIGAFAVNSDMGYMLLWGYFILFVLVIGMMAFLFALLSRFETNLVSLFVNTFVLCIKNLPRTIALCMICGVTIWVCVWLWWPVIFVPCLAALLASFFIEPVFAPFMPEVKEDSETEYECPGEDEAADGADDAEDGESAEK